MRHITIATTIAIVALGCALAWSYNFGTEAERTAFIPAKWKEYQILLYIEELQVHRQ